MMIEKMKNLKLEKVTLNCGTGTDPARLEKGYKMLSMLSGKKPIRIRSEKRIPAFGVRPGLQIGCKVTVRKKDAAILLKRLLEAIGNKLKEKQICPSHFEFGIKEYIEIPGSVYSRDIGIMGLEVCATLRRAGKRIEERKINRSKIPKRHKITKEETINFIKENFKTEVI